MSREAGSRSAGKKLLASVLLGAGLLFAVPALAVTTAAPTAVMMQGQPAPTGGNVNYFTTAVPANGIPMMKQGYMVTNGAMPLNSEFGRHIVLGAGVIFVLSVVITVLLTWLLMILAIWALVIHLKHHHGK